MISYAIGVKNYEKETEEFIEHLRSLPGYRKGSLIIAEQNSRNAKRFIERDGGAYYWFQDRAIFHHGRAWNICLRKAPPGLVCLLCQDFRLIEPWFHNVEALWDQYARSGWIYIGSHSRYEVDGGYRQVGPPEHLVNMCLGTKLARYLRGFDERMKDWGKQDIHLEDRLLRLKDVKEPYFQWVISKLLTHTHISHEQREWAYDGSSDVATQIIAEDKSTGRIIANEDGWGFYEEAYVNR